MIRISLAESNLVADVFLMSVLMSEQSEHSF